ncbi:hypothetical protein Godav_023537 [Gossypium davidsonii]|uniref:Uncharacterized protein n=1 Tax=Gossypium davidsonii TaxID=34287 RepID=A0A7J8STL2_GOSDV|nr:hypothetical protein [Gossypium davidsonii]
MMETIRTKIMLLIVKKLKKLKESCVQRSRKSWMCVPSHASGDRYQVECSLSSQHMVDLVENSCSCKIGISLASLACMQWLSFM